MKPHLIFAESDTAYLLKILAFILVPYLLAVAAWVLAVNRKRVISGLILVPAIVASLALVAGDKNFLSVAPVFICAVTLVL